MNVLLIAATPPQAKPLLGGSHRYLIQLARLVSRMAKERGGTVTIVSDEGANHEPLFDAIDACGIERVAAPFCSAPDRAARAVDELVTASSPNVVHVNGHQGWLADGLLQTRTLRNVPKRAFTMHLPLQSLESERPPPLKRQPFGWYARTRRHDVRFASLFTDIFSVSSVFATRGVESSVFEQDAVHFVPNAVDCDRLVPAEERVDRPFTMGALGELRSAKRVDLMIRALAALNADSTGGARARLRIAGEGPLEAEMRALAHALGVADDVQFLGFVRDLPGFFASIDALVMPSDFEAAPFSILEAMACGVPLAVTDSGDMGLMVRDGLDGFVTPVGDRQAFEASVHALATDPSTRREMGAAARERAVSTFSQDAWQRTMLAYYQRLLSA